MKTTFSLVLLCIAFAAAGADAPRKPFPDDYTPTKCPAVSCKSYEESEMASAGSAFLGFTLDPKWLQANLPKIIPEMQKLCDKVTTCFATANNSKVFCLDIMSGEFSDSCSKLYSEKADLEACRETVNTYLLGLDMKMQPRYDATRACAMQNETPRPNKTLDVWTVPAEIKAVRSVNNITVYAVDHDTHVPILGDITIEDQKVYSSVNPVGSTATGYQFGWPLKYLHVKNADGRKETLAPTITVTAQGYPPVSFRMPVVIPTVTVTVEPKLESLRTGKSQDVTVKVVDAQTGELVEGRVIANNKVLGPTNEPFKLDVRKGKRPDIWVIELSNGASDVLVK